MALIDGQYQVVQQSKLNVKEDKMSVLCDEGNRELVLILPYLQIVLCLTQNAEKETFVGLMRRPTDSINRSQQNLAGSVMS